MGYGTFRDAISTPPVTWRRTSKGNLVARIRGKHHAIFRDRYGHFRFFRGRGITKKQYATEDDAKFAAEHGFS